MDNARPAAPARKSMAIAGIARNAPAASDDHDADAVCAAELESRGA